MMHYQRKRKPSEISNTLNQTELLECHGQDERQEKEIVTNHPQLFPHNTSEVRGKV